jgi:hypothetical protein
VRRASLALARPGEVAQLVEHTTENRGVGSSILPLAMLLTVALLLVLGGTADARTRPPPPPLELPWAAGKTWSYLGGPHNTNGCPNGGFRCSGNHPWNSLDLTGADSVIRAAADGKIEATDRCPRHGSSLVIINHGQGWHTTYYHVAGVRLSPGDRVDQGQRIGVVSELHGCGGHADGAHVHFSVDYYKGAYSWTNGGVDLDGFQIGDWIFHDGRSQYSGCATNLVTDRHVCPGGQIRNDDGVACEPVSPAVWLTERNTDCPTARQAVILWNSFPTCRRDGSSCIVTTTEGDDPTTAIDWTCSVSQGSGPDELHCTATGQRRVVGQLSPA